MFVTIYIQNSKFFQPEEELIMITESEADSLFGIRVPIFNSDELIQFRSNGDSVVVYPIFTQSAYSKGGFYDYFRGDCDKSCLTVNLIHNPNNTKFTSSKNALWVFEDLNFDIVSDIDIHNNPKILEAYTKVILLHNEYITRNMYDAITNHTNVIYLYPNALYAEVEYHAKNDTISLIRGHGYPELSISNGFGWKFDNTHPYEYDTECKTWQFYKIDNGHMLNCYPEHVIMYNRELLHAINDL